jgi:predicted ATP-binding protein involved in virulence
MKLEKLKLTNFRGFREFEISFDPSFTVLLGANMAGKTAVLDGVAVSLTMYFYAWESVWGSGSVPVRNIEEEEVRQVVAEIGGVPDLQRQFPVIVEARVGIPSARENPVTWRLFRNGTSTETSQDFTQLPIPVGPPRGELAVIAQYGTQRVWRGKQSVDDLRRVGARYDGYADCFNITSTHSLLAGWMQKQTLVQLQRGSGYIQPQLAAVEAAIKCCIDGVTRFWFDVQYEELRLEYTGGDIQSFAMLSEGVRNMVAMVADIAWRAAVLNPQHGAEAHLLTEGVVLIDELDLHLHPSWQRRVVGDLRRTFPRIQFIVTTHSPQIVASVSRSQIRLLDHNRLVAEEPYVEGRDSNEILEDVFGVPSRPQEVEDEIKALYRLIEDEDFAAARKQLAGLEERLGPDDAAMIRARWILDTEEAQSPPHPSTPA